MLGKLIKHEWKAVWKFLAAINIFMICLTIIGCLGILFLGGGAYSSSREYRLTVELLGSVYMLTYCLSLFSLMVATIIYLGVRFYRSMYGEEGYLTHTLPATPLQLICSKAIVAIVWYAISYLVTAVSILFLLMASLYASDYAVSWAEIWDGLQRMGYEMTRSGMSPLGTLLLYGILCICHFISSIFIIYASISIGQLFDKHRILSSVGFYFAIITVIQIVSSIVFVLVIYYNPALREGNGIHVIDPIGWTYLGLSVLTGAAAFPVTYLLTTKKLNLE